MYLLEKDVIEGIRIGDRKVFDSVFRNYYSGLCTFALDYVKSRDTAQEIVQNVFYNLWENHEKIFIKSSLKAYLYRSVHNHCLNYIRDNSHTSRNNILIDHLSVELDLLSIEIPDDFFDHAFSEEVERELQQAIENLPEKCRDIFRLSRYENLSYPEIADKLNVSLSTVKTQMLRAMEKLSESMAKYLGNF